MKKRIIGVIVFVILSCLLAYGFHKTFVFKEQDGIQSIRNFYKCREDSVDVLFLGSSHVFMNVNNGELWDDYGIASYDLCAPGQPMWNTYYYLKEALKTQHPQLIVLDAYTVAKNEEYSETPSAIKSIYGMKPSRNKIDAIKVSVPKEDYLDFFLEYTTYHSRYKEIKKLDFAEYVPDNYYPQWKGQIISTVVVPFEKPVIAATDERAPLNEKCVEYYRKIIELAKSENIPVMVMLAPSVITQGHMAAINSIADITNEYDVPFVNFDNYYDEMELDFAVDFADGEHLNNNGSIKFSSFLGQYIKNNYEISDRRGQSGYEDYDVCANITFMKDYDSDIQNVKGLLELIEWANNDNYVVVYYLCGNYMDISNRDYLINALNNAGILTEVIGDKSYAGVTKAGKEIWNSAQLGDKPWIYELSTLHTMDIRREANGNLLFRVNTKEITMDEGLTVYIYDAAREEVVMRRNYKITDGMIEETK